MPAALPTSAAGRGRSSTAAGGCRLTLKVLEVILPGIPVHLQKYRGLQFSAQKAACLPRRLCAAHYNMPGIRTTTHGHHHDHHVSDDDLEDGREPETDETDSSDACPIDRDRSTRPTRDRRVHVGDRDETDNTDERQTHIRN